MYTSYSNYDSVATSALARSPPEKWDLYRAHETYPPSPTASVKRRESHRRGRKTKREVRPKSPTYGAEKIQSEAPEVEPLAQCTLRSRPLPDGGWEYYYHYYQPSDLAAPPKESVAKIDLNDPSSYISTPCITTDGTRWQSADLQPDVKVEAHNSVDGVEDNTSGPDQASAIMHPANVDWYNHWQIQRQEEASGYHSQYSSDNYDQASYAKPIHRTTTSKQKRRGSFIAPPRLTAWIYPGVSRARMKLGKVQQDRVDDWRRGVSPEYVEDSTQENQQYYSYIPGDYRY